ncbi:ATP-grasp fold amidoligase family protein [Microbulbifer sp. TRSA005]|uniref:ATP-grasp fold amidoligase family protein n=1 Tax=Microbulbifer sp. TRSA005 TaxID=3243383 RepID=UPI00403A2CCC
MNNMNPPIHNYFNDSPFLNFVAKNFHGNWTHSDIPLYAAKVRSAGLVSESGFCVPRRLATFESIEDLRNAESSLPESFVLKYSDAHSGIGIDILKSIDQGNTKCRMYRDILKKKNVSWNEICNNQEVVSERISRDGSVWYIEEKIESGSIDVDIPFDYKFYCFNGQVGAIVQIDRNVNPPRVVIFDGNFFPYNYQVDYRLDEVRWRQGKPLIPFRAGELIECAEKLSKIPNTPFVSVDLYDGKKGPVFGEFTFSPGATQTKMVVFSGERLNNFDRMFNGEMLSKNVNNVGVLNVDKLRALQSDVGSLRADDYRALATAYYLGDKRSALPISKLLESTNSDLLNYVSLIWSFLASQDGDGEVNERIARQIFESPVFENDSIQHYLDKAEAFYKPYVGKHNWFTLRLGRLLRKKSDHNQKVIGEALIRGLVELEYGPAVRELANIDNEDPENLAKK